MWGCGDGSDMSKLLYGCTGREQEQGMKVTAVHRLHSMPALGITLAAVIQGRMCGGGWLPSE